MLVMHMHISSCPLSWIVVHGGDMEPMHLPSHVAWVLYEA